MKLDVPALFLFGFVGVALLVAGSLRPSEALDTVTPTPSAPDLEGASVDDVRSIEITDPQPARLWFPTLPELLADPAINPRGVVLSEESARVAEGAFERASAEVSEIDDQYSRAQAVLARQRIERGSAELFVDGQSDRSPGDDAAVVVAQLEDRSGPWLVRISNAEFPQAAVWKEQVGLIREEAYVVLGRLLEEATGGDAVR